MNVKPGDYILAVNGIPVSTLPNLYDALIGTADKQVILRVNSKPADEGARDVTVVPISDESPLYYKAWVQKNVEEVSKKTNGEVGYIHIPDMGQAGLNEFTKQYFPQIKKKGLIVDVRGNGGGFVSPLVIERAPPRARHDRNSAQRHAANQPASDFRRSDGCVVQRVFRLRRRYLSLPFQGDGTGQIDRQTHLGRRRWHSRPPPAHRWRPALSA